jgi:hypothetical protein
MGINRGLGNKWRKTVLIYKEEGLLSLLIRFLIKLRRASGKYAQSTDPLAHAPRLEHILGAETSSPLEWLGTYKESLTFNWVMPPPGRGSGGHMTLFRCIQALERAGHTCRIYLYSGKCGSSVDLIREEMGTSFPECHSMRTMQWLEERETMAPADGVFATSWQTAYPVKSCQHAARKFYFVQDFEPYFYPKGALYHLAEATYRMGLHGITIGRWLAWKLHDEFGMETSHFEFGVDHSTYKLQNLDHRKQVLAYVRPQTDRRGLEITLLTLQLFHQKHPEVTINLQGADMSEFAIPFPYVNHGILEIADLNDLYNRCFAGLVLSFTNLSLVYNELASCGAIPVINSGLNTTMSLDNPHFHFRDPMPQRLAAALSECYEQRTPDLAQEVSESVGQSSWRKANQQFVEIVEQQMRPTVAIAAQ